MSSLMSRWFTTVLFNVRIGSAKFAESVVTFVVRTTVTVYQASLLVVDPLQCFKLPTLNVVQTLFFPFPNSTLRIPNAFRISFVSFACTYSTSLSTPMHHRQFAPTHSLPKSSTFHPCSFWLVGIPFPALRPSILRALVQLGSALATTLVR